MQNNNFLLDIFIDSKIVKQIAHEIINSKGSPQEIMASIAQDYNFDLPKKIKYEIHTASDDVYFFIIPAALDSIVGMEDFIVAAGNVQGRTATLGTVSSVSSFSSASCGATTFSVSSGATMSCMSTHAGFSRVP